MILTFSVYISTAIQTKALIFSLCFLHFFILLACNPRFIFLYSCLAILISFVCTYSYLAVNTLLLYSCFAEFTLFRYVSVLWSSRHPSPCIPASVFTLQAFTSSPPDHRRSKTRSLLCQCLLLFTASEMSQFPPAIPAAYKSFPFARFASPQGFFSLALKIQRR